MFVGRNPYKTCTPVTDGCTSLNARFAKVRERVPYEPLLHDDYPDGSCRLLSDVDLLFNQQRLDRMSLAALKQKLDEQVGSGDSGLSEIRQNIKDEDLHKFIKSRYIQSLSELRKWSSYLASEYAKVVDSIEASSKPVVDTVSPTGAAPVGDGAAE